MNQIAHNTLAVVGGIVGGSIANISLVQLGGIVFPPPEGADITNLASLAATMHLFEPKHYMFPFLAHAIGTLVGAFIAVRFVATKPFIMAMVVGCFFLIGGVMSAWMLPAPTWYIALDLLVAYLPMAWLGWWLAIHLSSSAR